MARERKLYTRKEMVEQIKACGQSIIDNADSILGDERYFLKLTVAFDIYRAIDIVPTIEINRSFSPELTMEDQVTYKELKLRKEDKKK